MATLESPGVQVQVIDESFYTPAAPGTVPMIFVASAQDKVNPSGTVAQGTTQANAGKVWLITSQRDLTDTFGTPVFYTDASGNPQHGSELNEYGLQAAYSTLGLSSRAYIVRADLDLASLVPTSNIPSGDPVSGTYWLDTGASTFGIKEWSSSTQKFTVKTPIVLNDDSPDSSFSGIAPSTNLGSKGDYAIVTSYSTATNNIIYRKNNSNTWDPLVNTYDSGKRLTISAHYSYPTFDASTATGSTWITTTTASNGANWVVKYYNGSTQEWTTVPAPLLNGVNAANKYYDSTGGGKNAAVGSLFVDYNTEDATSETANFRLWRKSAAGETVVTLETTANNSDGSYSFRIRTSDSGTESWSSVQTINLSATGSTVKIGSLIPAAISSTNVPNVTADWDADTNRLTITHTKGGNILLEDVTNTPLAAMGFVVYNTTTQQGTPNVYAAPTGYTGYDYLISNWKPLVYEAKATQPETDPADGRLWYSSVVDEVDIMYHNGTTWVGYKSSFPDSDPNGPIVSATEPTTQSDGTPLVTGDIWVSTADLENYGRDVYVYDSTISVGSKWVLQDVTDQSTPTGWLFADARWATAGSSKDPSAIKDLLSSGYLDPDAPDPALYPRGMRLWNTRRSGFNVKKYVVGYINTSANNGLNTRFSNQSMATYETDRWVSQYPVAADGGPQFGRHAQRAQVVNAFKETLDSNTAIRDTDTLTFNLLATPGYPEAIQNMIAFNTDRGLTAFVVGDTPFRLQPSGTALSEWGNNTNGALDNNDVGAVSFDEYMAMYYPSGFTNDNTGNNIVVPPSHMMLRTIINSDAKSFPWFAPAGTRRGGVDNATSVGYITDEGEFRSVALHQSLRDVLDDVKINPIATLTGVGILAYGQRTRARNASALDRINVSRLVCFLRRQLDIMARPFLFEPNDVQTRREIKAAAESIMLELVGQRALYDFIVVCDETNNTPARIDRNELYVDIAIEPVKAVEYIYIPLRLKNTGDIAAGL
jgi:hypothetical protein